MDRRTIVFLGPSLPWHEAGRLLLAEYRPPARMGDLYGLMHAGVERFVILDGVFHGVPSVWHREILDAIDQGIEVVGASSMGALRAAELHRFGMRGIGVVFEWYRDGVIDGDDEVALLHADGGAGFAALSVPMVNLRATLHALAQQDVIGAMERESLECWLKARHYPDRSIRILRESPLVRSWTAERQAAFAAACRDRFRDVKREDAQQALAWCAAHTPAPAARHDPEASRPERAMWRIGGTLRGTTMSPHGPITGLQLASASAADATLRPHLSRRAFLVFWARQRRVVCPPEATAREHDRWRRHRRPGGLGDGEFLALAGLTHERAAQLLAERALVSWLCEQGGSPFGIPEAAGDPALAFVADWARLHGVDADPAWLIARGPAHFGLSFHDDAARVEELRLTGDAIALAAAAGGSSS